MRRLLRMLFLFIVLGSFTYLGIESAQWQTQHGSGITSVSNHRTPPVPAFYEPRPDWNNWAGVTLAAWVLVVCAAYTVFMMVRYPQYGAWRYAVVAIVLALLGQWLWSQGQLLEAGQTLFLPGKAEIMFKVLGTRGPAYEIWAIAATFLLATIAKISTTSPKAPRNDAHAGSW